MAAAISEEALAEVIRFVSPTPPSSPGRHCPKDILVAGMLTTTIEL